MNYQIKEKPYKIKDLPKKYQPREKLKLLGVESLANYELLAIILNNGSRSEDILSLSKRILNDYGNIELINYKDVNNIEKHFKIPSVKACQIVALLEIGKRLFSKDTENQMIFNNPLKVYEYVKEMTNLKKEIFRGLYLNIKNKLIHDEILTMGNTIENGIVPQILFQPAINYYAQGIVIVHNHPSDDVTPSKADIKTTKSLITASKIIKIPILDHIIISKYEYFSFHDKGMLKD